MDRSAVRGAGTDRLHGTPAEQGSAPEEAVEYRIIEGSLPVTLLQVEELFAGEGMTDYTFMDSTGRSRPVLPAAFKFIWKESWRVR